MENTSQNQKGNYLDIEPRLKGVYETYVLWKSLPSLFRFPPMDKSGKRPSAIEFAEQMGIDDSVILELVNIKYQKEFAAKFGVDENTLSLWNRTIGLRDSLEDIRQWARHLSKNVITGLYNNAVRKGMAMEAKLWFQLIDKWSEKQTIQHEGLGDIHFNIMLNKKPDADKLGTVVQTDGSMGTSQ